MTLVRWSSRPEQFPSLVEAATKERELSWREWDAQLAQRGQPHKPHVYADTKASRIAPEALSLREQGSSIRQIAAELGVTRETARRAVLTAEQSHEVCAAMRERADALAVRGGGRVASRRSGPRGMGAK